LSRIFPHPLLAIFVVVMWLLLNRFSLGHLVLGTAVALVAGQGMAAVDPERPRVRRPLAILRLFQAVLVDVARSNVAVARLVLVGGPRRQGFVEIDLAIRAPTALAVLAVIVTSTPGTAWMDYDAARGRLLLHVFDLRDEDEWQRIVNDRYGALLKEIFE
jgi:multicomponent K+:H+ antiporter subunit E